LRVIALFLAVCSAVVADEANFEAAIIDDYVAVSKAQESRLEGATMEVDIAAEMPRLHKSGRLHALRRISALGRRITYDALRFEGDHSVKNEVIARYLTAESEALKSEPAKTAVTPVNYKFKYKGLIERDGRQLYAFNVNPRTKRPGLFVGELWIDSKTHLPVREAGRLVKNPSVFLKKVEFVRDYSIEDGISIPARAQYSVDTRLVGKTNLSVDFSSVSLPIPAGDSE
jgi:hypothetical protein